MKYPGVETANLALRLLERRQRDRYSPKIINEHTGEVVLTYADLEAPATKAKSPEEARKAAEAAKLDHVE